MVLETLSASRSGAGFILRFIPRPRPEALGQRCRLGGGRRSLLLDIKIGRKACSVDLERTLFAAKPTPEEISRLDAFKAKPHQSPA